MIFCFYVVLNLIVLYLFPKKANVLHSLEVIVYWMVSSYIHQNFSALCYMNFKTIEITDDILYELSHFLNRIVLFPVIMVTFLHSYLIINTFFKKILLFIFFIFLLVILEWLSDFLGVFKHKNWELWWSFAFWLSALAALIGFMKFFRKILYKKGGHI